MAKKKPKLLVIGQGRIGGTYCESFWGIDTDGKTGYECYRYPFDEEIPLMLADLARHRKKLRQELSDLAAAERLLKRAQSDERFRAKAPPGYK